ncbi:MAG: hypothetical protein QM535_21140 [Limnohabitans sp.]|nr:hypothetical protein [Limnohabitans sp.]
MGAKRSKSKKEFTGFVKDLDADDDGVSGDIATNQKEEIEKGGDKQGGGESLLGL